MPNLTVHTVTDPDAERMDAAAFEEHLKLLGGEDSAPGTAGYERVAVVAQDPDQARHAFIDLMARFAGDQGKVIWQQRPTVGERRNGAGAEHVITARFRVEG